MPHRSLEWPDTLRQLQVAFGGPAFAVHAPVPAAFGDEGAANHMRLAAAHGAPGVEVFVYGVSGGPFPARQHVEASRAVARLHRLDPGRTFFAAQSEEAIAAGAFHNDVVAVANERVLFAHEKAFVDPATLRAWCAERIADFDYVEVPEAEVPLADAVKSYLFNAQLVTPPDGQMTLVAPTECRDTPSVKGWIDRHIAGNGAIRRVHYVDVRQSMANGGGPACLRLRVQCDPAEVDPRFLLHADKIGRIEALVERLWPEHLEPGAIQSREVRDAIRRARSGLVELLELGELA